MIVRTFLLFQTFLAFKTITEVAGRNLRCYVCIPNTGSSISDVLQLFPKDTVIPLCNQFQSNNSEYIRECPSSSYQGCLTQTNGTHVTKTCTEVGIEDCKTANKIRYCYCKDELCNKEGVPTEAPIPPEISDAEDDEDSLSEGSGSPEGSESTQLETSSEADLGLEVIRKHLPTTTTTTVKSVILTTLHPDGVQTVKGDGNRFVEKKTLVFVMSLVFVFRFKMCF